ncbi:MAG: Bcr/CflA family multidrug efflux MFS transporter [Opitutaceae bacterium]|jgi:DHA1 family bicyclomycin/chloramphenicol resistance-like MFS transporter|nr:Bcr/CflA family multidrug efflux MFS transporter [Opitutaceae bacterium]
MFSAKPAREYPTPSPTPHARWRLIFILGALAAFGPLAIDMYLPALPAIARDLRAEEGAVQLTLSVFLVGVSLGQLVHGPLSDRIGRRGPLLFGMGLFVVAALGCALARSVEALIGWRLLMALGGSAGMGLSRTVVRDRFEVHEAADVFSLLMLVMGAAPILAPVLGGQMLLFTGWRGIFSALVAAGALVWVAVWRWLPESLPADRRNRLSVPGAVAGYGRLLADRRFLGYALVMAFSAGAMFTYITCAAHVFIELNGVSPQMFSVFFGINAGGMIAGSQLNRWLLRRFTSRQILSGVLTVVACAGALLAAQALTGRGGFPLLAGLLFVTLASGGLIGPNASALALAPFGRAAGSAASLMGTMQFGMGGLAGALAGVFAANSALPMCATQAVCGVASWAALRWMAKG